MAGKLNGVKFLSVVSYASLFSKSGQKIKLANLWRYFNFFDDNYFFIDVDMNV